MQRGRRSPSSFVFSHLVTQPGPHRHVFLYFHVPNRDSSLLIIICLFPIQRGGSRLFSRVFPCNEEGFLLVMFSFFSVPRIWAPTFWDFRDATFCFLYFIFFLLTTIPPPLNLELKVYDHDQTELRGSRTQRGPFCRFLLNAVRRVHEPSSPPLFFFWWGEPPSLISSFVFSMGTPLFSFCLFFPMGRVSGGMDRPLGDLFIAFWWPAEQLLRSNGKRWQLHDKRKRKLY